MPLDIAKYRPYVEHFDMTDEEKDELIRILYTIMEGFVDRAFGIHPVQLSCGSGAPGRSIGAGDTVNSEPGCLTHEFTKPTGPGG